MKEEDGEWEGKWVGWEVGDKGWNIDRLWSLEGMREEKWVINQSEYTEKVNLTI